MSLFQSGDCLNASQCFKRMDSKTTCSKLSKRSLGAFTKCLDLIAFSFCSALSRFGDTGAVSSSGPLADS